MKRVILTAVCLFAAAGVIYSESVSDRIISRARTLIGTPHKMGGISPSGFDCSGFISYLYKPHVPGIPRVSRDMAKRGNPVSRDRLLPGDLIFFATGNSPRRVTHVALYIGQNSIIHSISNGPERGVTVSSLNARYWKTRYHNSTRILKSSEAKSPYTAENMIFAKGIYNGYLKKGEPSGKGNMLLKNGDRYEGEFKDGLFHGRGIYIWSDGKAFKGFFEKGSFAGRGTLIMSDGNQTTGEWKENEFIPDSLPSVESEADGKAVRKPAGPKIKAESYIVTEDSPWNTYDGTVDGDFNLWFKKDMDAFEEWKKNN